MRGKTKKQKGGFFKIFPTKEEQEELRKKKEEKAKELRKKAEEKAEELRQKKENNAWKSRQKKEEKAEKERKKKEAKKSTKKHTVFPTQPPPPTPPPPRRSLPPQPSSQSPEYTFTSNGETNNSIFPPIENVYAKVNLVAKAEQRKKRNQSPQLAPKPKPKQNSLYNNNGNEPNNNFVAEDVIKRIQNRRKLELQLKLQNAKKGPSILKSKGSTDSLPTEQVYASLQFPNTSTSTNFNRIKPQKPTVYASINNIKTEESRLKNELLNNNFPIIETDDLNRLAVEYANPTKISNNDIFCFLRRNKTNDPRITTFYKNSIKPTELKVHNIIFDKDFFDEFLNSTDNLNNKDEIINFVFMYRREDSKEGSFNYDDKLNVKFHFLKYNKEINSLEEVEILEKKVLKNKNSNQTQQTNKTENQEFYNLTTIRNENIIQMDKDVAISSLTIFKNASNNMCIFLIRLNKANKHIISCYCKKNKKVKHIEITDDTSQWENKDFENTKIKANIEANIKANNYCEGSVIMRLYISDEITI